MIAFEKDSNYTLSTDKSFLQVDRIYNFLRYQSYWAQERTLEDIITTIDHSYCIGIYHSDTWGSFAIDSQIGFARVITDYSTFAYLCDVYVEDFHRGKGLSKWMLEHIFHAPEFSSVNKWMLGTRDAHSLYSKFGFKELAAPERWMERNKNEEPLLVAKPKLKKVADK